MHPGRTRGWTREGSDKKRIGCTFAVPALALAGLVGCAGSYGPQALKPGASLGEVTTALGSPTGPYPRTGGEPWPQAVQRRPQQHDVPWLHQAEALAWTPDGRGLYATGEFSPAPLLYFPTRR